MNIFQKTCCFILASASLTFAAQQALAQEDKEQAAAASETSQIQSMPEREQIYFSIEDIIKLALQNNLEISAKQIDPKIIDQEIISAEAVFDPKSEAETTYTFSKTEENPTTGLSNTNIIAASGGVSKYSPSGRTYSVTTGVDISAYDTDSLDDSYSPSIKLQLIQPTMKNAGEEINTTQIRVKKMQRDVSLSELNAKVIEVVSDIKVAYWNLVDARATLEAKRTSLKLANDLVKINEAQVDVGTLAPIEVLSAKAQAASRAVEVTSSELTVLTREDELKKLLNFPSNDSIWNAAIIPTDRPDARPYGTSVEDNIQLALANREELKQLRKAIEIQQTSLPYYENQLKPELNLIGGVGVVGKNEGDKGVGDSVGSFFSAENFNVTVGGSFSYPLGGNRAAKSALNKAKLEIDQNKLTLQNTEQQLAVQVRIAYRSLQTAYELIGVTRVARELAQEQLDAEQKKFNEGLSTNFQVLEYQDKLATAITTESQAITSYNQALVNLESATGVTLQQYNIVIEP